MRKEKKKIKKEKKIGKGWKGKGKGKGKGMGMGMDFGFPLRPCAFASLRLFLHCVPIFPAFYLDPRSTDR
jgi:hypothetical protein